MENTVNGNVDFPSWTNVLTSFAMDAEFWGNCDLPFLRYYQRISWACVHAQLAVWGAGYTVFYTKILDFDPVSFVDRFFYQYWG